MPPPSKLARGVRRYNEGFSSVYPQVVSENLPERLPITQLRRQTLRFEVPRTGNHQ
jgi:hypothetical protein